MSWKRNRALPKKWYGGFDDVLRTKFDDLAWAVILLVGDGAAQGLKTSPYLWNNPTLVGSLSGVGLVKFAKVLPKVEFAWWKKADNLVTTASRFVTDSGSVHPVDEGLARVAVLCDIPAGCNGPPYFYFAPAAFYRTLTWGGLPAYTPAEVIDRIEDLVGDVAWIF